MKRTLSGYATPIGNFGMTVASFVKRLSVLGGVLEERNSQSTRSVFLNWRLALMMDLLGKTKLAPITSRCVGRLTIPMKLNHGTRLHLRPASTDAYVVREIWGRHVYSHPLVNDALRGGLVVDVGAHIGAFAIHAVVRRKASKVLCFEPHPSNYEVLRRNIVANHCESIVAFPLAVASKRATRVLYLSSSNTGGHSLIRKSEERMEVGTISLSEVLDSQRPRHCDLLKLDAEGAEYEILLETPSEVLECVRCIVAECHAIDGSSELLEGTTNRLNGIGFDVEQRRTGPDTHLIFASRSLAS